MTQCGPDQAADFVARLRDLEAGQRALAGVVALGGLAVSALEGLLRGRSESVSQPRRLAAIALGMIVPTWSPVHWGPASPRRRIGSAPGPSKYLARSTERLRGLVSEVSHALRQRAEIPRQDALGERQRRAHKLP